MEKVHLKIVSNIFIEKVYEEAITYQLYCLAVDPFLGNRPCTFTLDHVLNLGQGVAFGQQASTASKHHK